ncbi:MAG: FliA/WhiG family RNA polymerase sigma factor [Bryobacterales bacterium]|nr:FliA/WhiG family RNA polymerase sigma factor [Bryobacterales bacterium]
MTSQAIAAYGQRHAPCPDERERLIMEHLPQVRLIAMRIHDRLPSTFQLEDLISTGIVGLIAAIDNFNPTLNVKLRTYAEFKIRGAILDSIRDLDGIPAHRRKQAKEISETMNRLQQRLQRSPTEQEIASELGIELAAYHELLSEVRAVTIGSLDDAHPSQDGLTLAGRIADEKQDLPLMHLQRAELTQLLFRGINAMPAPERTVLTLYYMKDLNLREIAGIMKLHLSRVAQLKTQAILRLRGLLATQWPSPKGIY